MSVSAIITTYKPHLKYLNVVLLNISNFTIIPNEIIICASSCNYALLNKYTDLNNFKKLNIKLFITNDKKNASQNRNKGISKATGEYIMIIDGDDLIHIKKLEICLDILKKNNNINLLTHSYSIFNNNWDTNRKLIYPIQIYKTNINHTCSNIYSIPDISITHGHIFIKSNILKELKYNENKILGQDGDLCQRVIKKFGEVYVINEKLIGYRK